MADVVSNYPREEEPAVMTPEVAKSALELNAFLRIWAIVPHVLWTLRAFLTSLGYISGSSLEVATFIMQGAFISVSVLTASALRDHYRNAGRPKAQAWWALLPVAIGLVPIVGAIGPILLLHKLSKDMEKFGHPTRGWAFPKRQLQGIADGPDVEVLTEPNA